ncbi:MAG: hypothetical protein IKU33_03430, partial [Bacteroidales bacterium]|nr:hypothetical protein [Bacteroidales bacterium]
MDISVYDNYSGANRDFDFFEIDGEYKMCDSFLTILCMRGRAIFKIRIHEFEISRGSYMLIRANDPFQVVEVSDDFHIDVVRVGESVFSMSYDDVLKKRLELLSIQRPTSKISARKTMMFHIIHSYLKVLMKERNDFYRDMILYEYVKIFLYEACHILDDTASQSNLGKKDRNITSQFFQNVDRYYKENRKVEYYAQLIGITPKHLAHIIKKTTGKYPSEWLENYAILES